MPTGYTAAIADGITFEEYALSCARAFGALIDMRDDPANTPIPESFAPSDYHQKALEKAHKRLDVVRAMTAGEVDIESGVAHRAAMTSYRERLECAATLRAKYESMLVSVRAYVAPSLDHVKYKAFMESQILESIKFDCSTEYDVEPVRESPEQWYESTVQQLRDDVAYYEEHQRQEVERTHNRNQWVKALRESLK